jgi:predicted RNA-binding Zn-ribbon protein involved in translation (DUF1610 family)
MTERLPWHECPSCGARREWSCAGVRLDAYWCHTCGFMFDVRHCCGHSHESIYPPPDACPACGEKRMPKRLEHPPSPRDPHPGTVLDNPYGRAIMAGKNVG